MGCSESPPADDPIVIELPPRPALVLDGPASATTFEDSTVVSGRVYSERAVASFIFTLDGNALPSVSLTGDSGDYAFSATVPLAVGDNLVAARVIDDLDRSAEAAQTVVRALDQEAPRVAVTWPRDGHGVRTARWWCAAPSRTSGP